MNTLTAVIVLVLLGMAILLAAIRVWKGPSSGNSAVAGDLIFFAFIGAVAVLGVLFEIDSVMDLILISALLGFLSVLSLARWMQGGKR
jgi:multicomponent Na+:H+ antiporter subunit F